MTRPLRVVLIALLAAGRSGVPRYTGSLVRALDRVASEYDGIELEVVTTEAAAPVLRSLRLRVTLVGRALGSPREGFRRILAEQIAARTRPADLLHFFDLTGPVLAPRRRFVTTLHDAAGARGRETLRFGYKRFVQPWALERATAVVAVSAFSGDEAVSRFGVNPNRITVIRSGPGLEPPLSPRAAVDRDGDFLLYVGDLSTHKNLPFLLDVFERAGTPERLILVGRKGDGHAELLRRIEASPARSRIVTLVDASDAELEGLYARALATVLPSRYEGFGFTPLEAMARDCPVIASDIPALREVAGDGAFLVPLESEAEWVEAVRRVAGSDQLRVQLRDRGRRLVSRYSWDRTARDLCELFASLGA